MAVPKFPELEERILRQWQERQVFKKSLQKPAPKGNFVFYEGPPTANGQPGIHHLISRAFKDVIPRFRTMRGFSVERKAGWDTHGLPVEIEVEKQLKLRSKTEIEKYGVAAFNAKCKESVWAYKKEWDRFTERSGFWLDLEHPYITYTPDYIETLWWITKKIDDRGLLYQGFKVVPHCPRCGTTLSSHELAQGYDEVDDPSVYVRFKILRPKSESDRGRTDLKFSAKGGSASGGKNTSFLVWTTTPWTLPGNVALAVGKKILYSEVELADGEHLILASARLSVLLGEYKVVREFPGSELIGIEYVPIFDFVKYKEKAHYVAPADFVSTEEGTGIVHTAVMYGADDFALGQKIGLPQQHVVDEQGMFMPVVAPWAGMFVKDADKPIIEDLRASGKLYRAETVHHTYPFCWRCHSPVIYYAKPSWYFKTTAVQRQMLKANKEIHWEPKHLKDGRFGEWLLGIKDWAITRERYWGTPLPVWRCEAGHTRVIGSLDELNRHRTDTPARVIFVRHGEAQNNVLGTIASGPNNIALTEHGRTQVSALAKKLSKEKIAAVYSSPITRTKETAAILANALGQEVRVDERLIEIQFGVMDRKTETEYHAFFANEAERWTKSPQGGENWTDVRARMLAFFREIDAKHRGETVVVVTHGDPLFVIDVAVHNIPIEGQHEYRYPKYGTATEITLPNWPWNDAGELDLHRPYIDEIVLRCADCALPAKRVKDVIDVWFDSGAMPFAQWHYPFENKERIDKGVSYPADYISEAIDQTRGWFYTLLAVNALLGYKHPPYRNVVCMNHILDAKGQKMSKSKGNVVDPWQMFEKYGSDAVRFFLYTVNQPGDYKRFDEKEVDGVVKKVFLILWNVMEFWKMSTSHKPQATSSDHILDQWLQARLNQLVSQVTDNFENYKITEAGRAIAGFVNELSTWYVRRSRERLRAGEGVALLHQALMTVTTLLAPMTPFLADALCEELGGVKESVHLEDWPVCERNIDKEIIDEMDAVRSIVELGHALRDEAKVKVRQPLAEVEIEKGKLKNIEALLLTVAEELNVKTAQVVDHVEEREGWRIKTANGLTVGLNTVMTDELKREGWLRELSRQINDLRKEMRFTVSDKIVLTIDAAGEARLYLESVKDQITAQARASRVEFGKVEVSGREVELDGEKVKISAEKAP